MTTFNSSPTEVLAADVGVMRAHELIAALRTAGYIVVRSAAIGDAQREAVAAYKEDAMVQYRDRNSR